MAAQPLSRWPWRVVRSFVRPEQTMRYTAQIVADKYGLTLGQMKERTLRPAITRPRIEAMAAMHEAGYSHAQSAGFFGLKLHASINAEKHMDARALAQQEAA